VRSRPVVPCPPSAHRQPSLPPDLAAVVTAWPALPEAIRAGILAMVKAAAVRPGRRVSDKTDGTPTGGGGRR
jgi:hypothetical protein